MKKCVQAASIVAIATLIPSASAGSDRGGQFTDPIAIDQAVARYTGAGIGTAGGARGPVDRRLRLSACRSSLLVQPYGRRQDSVQVSCPDANGWRIFVPLLTTARATPVPEVVSRGDSVSIAVTGRGFSVIQSGRALEAGAVGDWIKVEPPGNRATIRARVERAGRVAVPLH